MEKNTYEKRNKRKYNKPLKYQGDGNNGFPQRKRRVSVDRDVEVVIVSNTIGNFYYENPRMNMAIDLEHINDEEYVTVGDLRTILNSNRKILEGFSILITEVLSDEYTLDDVLVFLGLRDKYDDFYSLTRKSDKVAEVKDIKDFLTKAPLSSFEKTMEKISSKLRERVIETAITMFKLKEFGDYNKMRIIEEYVNDEIFLDAKESEVVDDIYI
ncbi:hypothetical protein JR311_19920 (plasmid) [Bacillus velezensis]|uniref:hypothetical protein n=1 Tax=Bacillus velezensis TaxID=492670 RepID=UPI00049F3C56|nr:hypothetical protein [Bacillus velezensis]KDN90452.1 hypothetical protein EF87_20960 [Bacillus amyloliquefaciens]QRV11473.1 hypothetical protein JR311_19920 [Bacillus velezensis]URJ76445.1 hypothetical protein MF619_004018 [Bacillus velezensis]URJ80401.1 hypothetical protein MF621_004152 [Bacillus velezensis]